MGQQTIITLGQGMEPAATDPGGRQRTFQNSYEDEATNYFAEFFTHSLDLLCVAGREDGYFKYLNPAWTTLLGWGIEELLAKPFLDFVHPDDRELTLAEVANLADEKATTSFENRYRHVDGSYRWLQWNARSSSKLQCIYAVARDVTRQKRQEREILEIVDHERSRLGREMHDGLCQTLAGIAALAATLEKKLAHAHESGLSARADEIKQLLKTAIRDGRDMARGLDPMEADGEGLAGALSMHAAKVERMFGISCRCEGHFGDTRPGREVETHLFRIAQEAISNVIAHAHAEKIVIGLLCEGGQGTLSIRDDGVGLAEDSQYGQGMGLHTMSYRARLINASLEVRRRKTKGTAVICTIPLRTTV